MFHPNLLNRYLSWDVRWSTITARKVFGLQMTLSWIYTVIRIVLRLFSNRGTRASCQVATAVYLMPFNSASSEIWSWLEIRKFYRKQSIVGVVKACGRLMFGHEVSVVEDEACQQNSGAKTPVKTQIYDRGDGRAEYWERDVDLTSIEYCVFEPLLTVGNVQSSAAVTHMKLSNYAN
jgi:hypothetical protein